MYGSGSFATAAIAGELLVTIGRSEIFSAFDLKTGELKWRVDFPKDHEGGGNVFGSASSPLIIGDGCLVQAARNKGVALYCFNVKSGEILWRKDNQGEASAPLVAMKLQGETLVMAKSSKGISGLGLGDGQAVW